MHERSNTKTIDNEAEIDDLVAPEFDEQSPPIYELPVELMMEIFNSLALKDLDSVSQTSKWWQKVAHACFRQNYSFLRTGILKKRLVFTRERGFEAFKQLIPILSITNTLDFKHFVNTQLEFHQLREIQLWRVNLTKVKIECIKPVFSKLERLIIGTCRMKANFITQIIALTPNIKHLFLAEDPELRCTTRIGTKWPLQKYPTLNHFGFATNKVLPITSFLELNPNIRSFETNSANIWVNRNSLRASKVTLDDLAVSIDRKEYYEKFANHTEITMFASICVS